MNKNIYIFFTLVLFISFVSATLSTYPSKQVNEEFNFTQTCQDATYITLSTIITPNSTDTTNINMTSTGAGSFVYNYTPILVGTYDFNGISDGCLNTFAVSVEITPNGKTYSTGDSLIYIFVALFFVAMMLGFHRLSKAVNYENWYESIKEKYITRNSVKWVLGAISYNIMTNSYIVYFLLGLPIILILTDLTFLFNVTSIALYMQSLLYIYVVFIIVLGIVFLSYAQEWFMDFIEDIQNIDWGIENDK